MRTQEFECGTVQGSNEPHALLHTPLRKTFEPAITRLKQSTISQRSTRKVFRSTFSDFRITLRLVCRDRRDSALRPACSPDTLLIAFSTGGGGTRITSTSRFLPISANELLLLALALHRKCAQVISFPSRVHPI